MSSFYDRFMTGARRRSVLLFFFVAGCGASSLWPPFTMQPPVTIGASFERAKMPANGGLFDAAGPAHRTAQEGDESRRLIHKLKFKAKSIKGYLVRHTRANDRFGSFATDPDAWFRPSLRHGAIALRKRGNASKEPSTGNAGYVSFRLAANTVFLRKFDKRK